MDMKAKEFWFVVGSQFLYGPEVLETVAARAQEMAEKLSRVLPYPLLYKVTAKTNQEIAAVVKEATLGTRLQYTWYNSIDFVRTVWFSLQMLVTGSAGVGDLSGPVGIVSTINEVGAQSASVADALANIAYFGAMIAVNLAVMNLLPIPALDGGHIMFLVVSTVSEKAFRKKIPMKYEAAINMVFLALLMGLMLFVTFNDVMKLIR